MHGTAPEKPNRNMPGFSKRQEEPVMAHNIGEKPGKGKYCCTSDGCDWSVVLDDTADALPPCDELRTGSANHIRTLLGVVHGTPSTVHGTRLT